MFIWSKTLLIHQMLIWSNRNLIRQLLDLVKKAFNSSLIHSDDQHDIHHSHQIISPYIATTLTMLTDRIFSSANISLSTYLHIVVDLVTSSFRSIASPYCAHRSDHSHIYFCPGMDFSLPAPRKWSNVIRWPPRGAFLFAQIK